MQRGNTADIRFQHRKETAPLAFLAGEPRHHRQRPVPGGRPPGPLPDADRLVTVRADRPAAHYVLAAMGTGRGQAELDTLLQPEIRSSMIITRSARPPASRRRSSLSGVLKSLAWPAASTCPPVLVGTRGGPGSHPRCPARRICPAARIASQGLLTPPVPPASGHIVGAYARRRSRLLRVCDVRDASSRGSARLGRTTAALRYHKVAWVRSLARTSSTSG